MWSIQSRQPHHRRNKVAQAIVISAKKISDDFRYVREYNISKESN